MALVDYIIHFGAGALLCNSIPHLAAGMRGELFPSPFASPPGIGNSRPAVNVFWGWCNAVAGIALLDYAPLEVGMNAGFVALALGALVGGCLVATHFGRVRAAKR